RFGRHASTCSGFHGPFGLHIMALVVQQSFLRLIPFLVSSSRRNCPDSPAKCFPRLSSVFVGTSPTIKIRFLPLPPTSIFGLLHCLYALHSSHFGNTDVKPLNCGGGPSISINPPLRL